MKIDYGSFSIPNGTRRLPPSTALLVCGRRLGKTTVITYRRHTRSSGESPTLDPGSDLHEQGGARDVKPHPLVTGQASGQTVSTFHSFGVKILLGIGPWATSELLIYDEADRNQLIKDCAASRFAWKFRRLQGRILFSRIRSQQTTWTKADDAYRGLYDEYRRSLHFSTPSISTTSSSCP